MHGVGLPFAERGAPARRDFFDHAHSPFGWSAAFAETGIEPFIIVPEQAQPDPDFPTVKFPNPEEGKSALTLSMKLAGAPAR